MNKERSASDLKVEGRSLMFFMYVERRKKVALCKCSSSLSKEEVRVFVYWVEVMPLMARKNLDEWEVDGSMVEALLR
jgi:hypothetical protein